MTKYGPYKVVCTIVVGSVLIECVEQFGYEHAWLSRWHLHTTPPRIHLGY